MLTEQQRTELEELTKPVSEWLANNVNPHTRVIVECDHMEVHEMDCRINFPYKG